MPRRVWQEPPGANENGQVGRWDIGKGKARAALSARKCRQRYMAICPVKTAFLRTKCVPGPFGPAKRAFARTKARCSDAPMLINCRPDGGIV